MWRSDVNGGYSKEQVAKMHPCTDNELKKFYTPGKAFKKRFDVYVKSKAFMCMDDVDILGKPL